MKKTKGNIQRILNCKEKVIYDPPALPHTCRPPICPECRSLMVRQITEQEKRQYYSCYELHSSAAVLRHYLTMEGPRPGRKERRLQQYIDWRLEAAYKNEVRWFREYFVAGREWEDD